MLARTKPNLTETKIVSISVLDFQRKKENQFMCGRLCYVVYVLITKWFVH